MIGSDVDVVLAMEACSNSESPCEKCPYVKYGTFCMARHRADLFDRYEYWKNRAAELEEKLKER